MLPITHLPVDRNQPCRRRTPIGSKRHGRPATFAVFAAIGLNVTGLLSIAGDVSARADAQCRGRWLFVRLPLVSLTPLFGQRLRQCWRPPFVAALLSSARRRTADRRAGSTGQAETQSPQQNRPLLRRRRRPSRRCPPPMGGVQPKLLGQYAEWWPIPRSPGGKKVYFFTIAKPSSCRNSPAPTGRAIRILMFFRRGPPRR